MFDSYLGCKRRAGHGDAMPAIDPRLPFRLTKSPVQTGATAGRTLGEGTPDHNPVQIAAAVLDLPSFKSMTKSLVGAPPSIRCASSEDEVVGRDLAGIHTLHVEAAAAVIDV